MNEEPTKEQVVGQVLIGIGHSAYTEPEFIVEGIGPASFRSHYLTLGNGLVLDFFTAMITVASHPDEMMPSETVGIPLSELIGRRIIGLVRDDTHSALVVLDDDIFLKDDNDGFYGNPLLAGRLRKHYTAAELAQFIDYWSEHPASLGP
jgi:hypothetical protein